MTIDELVDYVFSNTDCQFCIRRNCGSCCDIVGGCKKYIKELRKKDQTVTWMISTQVLSLTCAGYSISQSSMEISPIGMCQMWKEW